MAFLRRISSKKNRIQNIKNNMSIKLVIMVSMYDSGEWIKNRLDNLMKITVLPQSEIWCINANSPDPRDHSIPQEYPVIYHKLDERIGVYAAWNYILQRSSSQYITNANTDDIVAPNCYEKLITFLEGHPKYDFVYPSWHCTTTPNQQWEHLSNIDMGGQPGNFAGDLDRAGVGHFPLWRRSVHDRIGLFDESFKAAGDAEWWMRAYYKGNSQFYWYNEFLACYLWRGETDKPNLWQREITSEEWAKLHTKVQEYRAGP